METAHRTPEEFRIEMASAADRDEIMALMPEILVLRRLAPE